jgi:hypothetical protein
MRPYFGIGLEWKHVMAMIAPEMGGSEAVTRSGPMDEIQDAQSLRLFALKEDVEAEMVQQLPRQNWPELTLIPGDPPRLWVDRLGWVSMTPDPRSYCFELDGEGGRSLVLQTRNREEMVAAILDYASRRQVVKQRVIGGFPANENPSIRGYSTAALMLAWLSGFALGIFGLLAYLTQFGMT